MLFKIRFFVTQILFKRKSKRFRFHHSHKHAHTASSGQAGLGEWEADSMRVDDYDSHLPFSYDTIEVEPDGLMIGFKEYPDDSDESVSRIFAYDMAEYHSGGVLFTGRCDIQSGWEDAVDEEEEAYNDSDEMGDDEEEADEDEETEKADDAATEL